MKCVVCKQGPVVPGVATVVLERDGALVVVRRVPARVCSNCGEEYVDDEAARRMLDMVDEVAAGGVEVEIREYAAA